MIIAVSLLRNLFCFISNRWNCQIWSIAGIGCIKDSFFSRIFDFNILPFILFQRMRGAGGKHLLYRSIGVGDSTITSIVLLLFQWRINQAFQFAIAQLDLHCHRICTIVIVVSALIALNYTSMGLHRHPKDTLLDRFMVNYHLRRCLFEWVLRAGAFFGSPKGRHGLQKLWRALGSIEFVLFGGDRAEFSRGRFLLLMVRIPTTCLVFRQLIFNAFLDPTYRWWFWTSYKHLILIMLIFCKLFLTSCVFKA